jgi:iron complex outermembrane receptor protein
LETANTNWQDLIYQEAWGTDNNLSLSGGVKWLPYRLSIGYNEQNGILRTNEFKRTSVGLNLNPKFFDNHLTINANLKGTFMDTRFANEGAIGAHNSLILHNLHIAILLLMVVIGSGYKQVVHLIQMLLETH